MYTIIIILKRIPLILRSEEDAVNFSKQIFSNLVVPIFLISNVTGQNIPLIVKFMNLLPSNNEHINNSGMDTELFISNTYESNGIKILGGTVIKGTIKEK
jgi:GTPase